MCTHVAVSKGDYGASKHLHDNTNVREAEEDHGGGTICGWAPGDYVSAHVGLLQIVTNFETH